MLAYQPRPIFVSFQAQQTVYVFAKSSEFKPISVFLNLKSNFSHQSVFLPGRSLSHPETCNLTKLV